MPLSTSRRLTLLTSASLALLTGCGSSSDSADAQSTSAKVPVVASTNVYGDIVRSIGADKVDVTSVISDPDQDPHSYEADTQNQLALSKAKVVVENGGGYDDFVDRMLKSGHNDSAQVINAVRVSGKTAPKGGELNEHVWYDFPTVARVADRISAALAQADPADAAAFKKNATAFKAKLAPLEAKEAQIKKEHDGEAVAITEPVPLYMIDASGLVNKTPAAFSEAIEEGDDVSPRILQESLALFSGKKVRVLVYNEQTSGPQTEKSEAAAKAAGIPVIPVTETLPKGKDYLGWMTANVDALASALAK
ncbi:metal ABC transporter solute-binding protein, Zn/Mn family [Streptomyces caelestis]|jgi:zinc/manganese transport system substrate-binding protein|uniref:Zinc/manganese transport system substrate-binding protein n=1 Tax=Streptomyces caelestis TaxID=36816 RepID=A0A7W9GZH3_9ACTN|nr:zinc ABC transporter substrate-binding protein [Streptomyces caelestis]MBB5792579.1 zinc/manganese transport system substrate-binding protein [Streptomyces caelestis]GGW70313.1 metal ABC transporter substrate-binding protein [Streptomyces caelestis]